MGKFSIAALTAAAALVAAPAFAATTVQVDVFNVQEEFTLELVNGAGQVTVGSVSTGGSQTFDLAGLLTTGTNTLFFSLNDADGVDWSYGWRVYVDGVDVGSGQCGVQGVSGCAISPFGGTVWSDSFDVQAVVPEPATWATMIAGFGLAGAALRRRPRRATA